MCITPFSAIISSLITTTSLTYKFSLLYNLIGLLLTVSSVAICSVNSEANISFVKIWSVNNLFE